MSMNIMREAFVDAGVYKKSYPKGRAGKVRCDDRPLVIESQFKVMNGRVVRVPKRVFKVKHLLSNGRCITEGGDTWKFEDMGNNYLKAIGAY